MAWVVTAWSQPYSTLRGIYFDKYQYEPHPLPSYFEVKDVLPQPILQKNPEYIDLYWKAWQLAFERLKNPPADSPLLSHYIDEPHSGILGQWDTASILTFMKYAYPFFSAIEVLDNFYGRQHDSGYICSEINPVDGRDVHLPSMHPPIDPPLFSWLEVEWYRFTADDSRFKSIIPVLIQYAAWIEKNKIKKGANHGLFFNVAMKKKWEESFPLATGSVDLSSQMALFYQQLAIVCEHVGMDREAARCRRRAQEITTRINHFMWNEIDSLYNDIAEDGRQIACSPLAGFWPMIAGIASPIQAGVLVESMMDSSIFWQVLSGSSDARNLSYPPSERMGSGAVCPLDHYLLLRSLQSYGFQEPATKAAETFLDIMSAVYRSTGTLWENYAVDPPAPGPSARADWVGAGIAPIALLIEQVIGIRVDAANHQITWYLHRTDEHGVENLTCGSANVSMLCRARKWPTERAIVRVETPTPIRINFIHPLGNKTIRFKEGIREVAVPN